MKTFNQVNAIMLAIPENSRYYWCGGERGPCACLGCVQVCNRVIMYEKTLDKIFIGDPEYIDESKIPKDIFNKYKITKEEWEMWKEKGINL